MTEFVDDSEQSRGIEPGLYWGVRESFLSYIVANPDGQIYGENGVETDGQGTFRFPIIDFQPTATNWTLSCNGLLQFVAHMGMLNFAISRPRLALTTEGGLLSIDSGNGERRGVVCVESLPPTVMESEWLVFPPLKTFLTPEGAALFGDSYEPGTEFDPINLLLRFDKRLTDHNLWLWNED